MSGGWGGERSNTLRVPITVTLKTLVASRNLTRYVSNVQFRSTAPGGFATCTLSLNRPFNEYLPEMQQYATLRLTDGRSGAVLWEGRLEDPGRTADASGFVWELTATGLQAHAKDITRPYVAVDTDLTRWQRGFGTLTYVSDSQEDDQDVAAVGGAMGPTIKFTATAGISVPTLETLARSYYLTMAESNQEVGSLACSARVGPMTGPLASEHRAQIRMTFDSTMTSFSNLAFSSTALDFPVSIQIRFGQDWLSHGMTVPVLEWQYINTSQPFTTTADSWVKFGDTLTVRPIMRQADGTQILPTDFARHDVFFTNAAEIIADLLGSDRLPNFDGPNATVVPSDFRTLNQFAYPDPVTADQLFTDLMTLEPTRYWAVWELNSTGRARFEWVLWPSQVRYVIPITGGLSIPMSSEEVFDRVSVRWTDALGRIRRTVRSKSAPILAAANFFREAAIDLGDNVGTQDMANDAGDNFLNDHNVPFGAGSITVAAPVMDLLTGRLVWPWEIRPGCLIQAAGVDPSAYNQGATSRNGRNVFRVVATDFNSSDGTVSLDLDSPTRSVWDQIGTANRTFEERRRR